MRSVYVDGQRFVLDPARLIQAGGEGMVFGVGRHALKCYHRPGPVHEAKVEYLLQPEIRQKWPANVMAPDAIIRDAHGKFAGFRMGRLPAGTYPMKKLASAQFCRKQGVDAGDVLPLLQEIHTTLATLHRAGIVVGDVNDHNIFFRDPRRPADGPGGACTYWVDVDSFQCGPHPCPVAAHTFLDPNLYTVKDFGQRPVFSALSDWYAFFVLVVKCLLHVHPFGGVHHAHKSLASRAQARITVFSPDVVYPKNARPPTTLSNALLDYAERVFGQGQRSRFPEALLAAYRRSLQRCGHCDLAFPREQMSCPACQRAGTQRMTQATGTSTLRHLFAVDGPLQHVAIQGRHIIAVVRTGQEYRLVRAGVGGVLAENVLFSGRADYRFGYFGKTVVVNSAGSSQLLLLDIGEGTLRQVALLESDSFQDQAAFATTATHLYRLTNGYMLKGQVRHGHYVEEVVATVHRRQTQLWADPAADRVAGCYRIFDRYHFFIVDGQGNNHDARMAPVSGERGSVKEMAACFGRQEVAFLWQTARGGLTQNHGQVCSGRGELHYHFRPEHGGLQGRVVAGNRVLVAADGAVRQETVGGSATYLTVPSMTAGDILLPHPAGLLVQQSAGLYLLPNHWG